MIMMIYPGPFFPLSIAARAHQQSQSDAVAGSPAGPPAPLYVLGAGVTLPAATAVGLPPGCPPYGRRP